PFPPIASMVSSSLIVAASIRMVPHAPPPPAPSPLAVNAVLPLAIILWPFEVISFDKTITKPPPFPPFEPELLLSCPAPPPPPRNNLSGLDGNALPRSPG